MALPFRTPRPGLSNLQAYQRQKTGKVSLLQAHERDRDHPCMGPVYRLHPRLPLLALLSDLQVASRLNQGRIKHLPRIRFLL